MNGFAICDFCKDLLLMKMLIGFKMMSALKINEADKQSQTYWFIRNDAKLQGGGRKLHKNKQWGGGGSCIIKDNKNTLTLEESRHKINHFSQDVRLGEKACFYWYSIQVMLYERDISHSILFIY